MSTGFFLSGYGAIFGPYVSPKLFHYALYHLKRSPKGAKNYA